MKKHQSGKKRGGVILPVISAVLLLLLVGLLYYDHLNEEKDKERLEELAAQQKAQKEQEILQEKSKFDKIQDVADTYIPGIVCWGDSLTAGAGGAGVTYPNVLQELINSNLCDPFDLSIPVVNMGVGGEDTNTILGRNGAVVFVTESDIVIPGECSPVEIKLLSSNGRPAAPLRQGNKGMDSVTINGVEGVISIEQTSYTSTDYTYYFTRSKAGDPVTVQAGTTIVTSGAEEYKDYLLVLFMGQNGGYKDIDDLIAQQRAVIEQQTDLKDRFIIIGLHTGTEKERAELEAAMEAEYGGQYINLREYMSTEAIEDAESITGVALNPSQKDLEMLSEGAVPECLLSDTVHFNSTGYELIGNLIYNRMEKLGYFNEVLKAIEENSN